MEDNFGRKRRLLPILQYFKKKQLTIMEDNFGRKRRLLPIIFLFSHFPPYFNM
jgi:hypothetical protein